MIVRILRQQCNGNGVCREIAPEVFALDSKNKATVLDPDAISREELIEVAEACPCSAIILTDDEGSKVFP
jgi:ferredoxin